MMPSSRSKAPLEKLRIRTLSSSDTVLYQSTTVWILDDPVKPPGRTFSHHLLPLSNPTNRRISQTKKDIVTRLLLVKQVDGCRTDLNPTRDKECWAIMGLQAERQKESSCMLASDKFRSWKQHAIIFLSSHLGEHEIGQGGNGQPRPKRE